MFLLFNISACGIVSAADDGESYDTDDIDGPKMLTQSLVRSYFPIQIITHCTYVDILVCLVSLISLLNFLFFVC